MPSDGPILYFDGECGLCDRSVRWLMDRDVGKVLRFAPLQGSTYAALSIAHKPSGMGTVVLHDASGLHVRSAAALGAMRHLGGKWGVVATAGLMVPRPIRDWAYDFIAARRLKWFGGKESCRLPSRAEREQLLP